MQFSLYVNQLRAIEWGMNANQCFLLDYLLRAGSWAERDKFDGLDYFWISRHRVLEELPIIGGTADAIYRIFRQLDAMGLIQYRKIKGKDWIWITEKGRLWNSTSAPPKNSDDDPNQHKKQPKSPPKNSDSDPNQYKKQPDSDAHPSLDSSKNDPIRMGVRENSDGHPTYSLSTNNQSKNQGMYHARDARAHTREGEPFSDDPIEQTPPPDPSLADSLADRLGASLLLVNPKFLLSDRPKWVSSVRAMLGEGRTADDIFRVWNWAIRDRKTSEYVLTPWNLHSQFDRVSKRMENQAAFLAQKQWAQNNRPGVVDARGNVIRLTRDVPIQEQVTDTSWAY